MRSCSRWGLPSRSRHRDRWCALTAPFHPCPLRAGSIQTRRRPAGGLLSVALSVGSRPLGVTQHLALWSSDFPRSKVLNLRMKRKLKRVNRDHLGDSEPRTLSSVSLTSRSARAFSSRGTETKRTRGSRDAAWTAAAYRGL